MKLTTIINNTGYERNEMIAPGRKKGNPKLLETDTCLHFANTIENRSDKDNRRDLIESYRDFIQWCISARVISSEQAARLLASAGREESAGMRALADALELREIIHRIFRAKALGREPVEQDMRGFNAFHARAMAASTLLVAGSRYAVTFAPVAGSLDWPLNPIAWSAAQLLTGDGLERVKICSDERCGWLFIDESRNGSRRWCDMSGCGNRAKARRHYQRRAMRGGITQPSRARRIEKPTQGDGMKGAAEYRNRSPSEPEMEIGSDD